MKRWMAGAVAVLAGVAGLGDQHDRRVPEIHL
jgi:hypothetical protein